MSKQAELFSEMRQAVAKPYDLRVTIDPSERRVELEWSRRDANLEPYRLNVRSRGADELTWEDYRESFLTTRDAAEIRKVLDRFRASFATEAIIFGQLFQGGSKTKKWIQISGPPHLSGWKVVENAILNMAEEDAVEYLAEQLGTESILEAEPPSWIKRIRKEENAAIELERRVEEGARRIEAKRREKELERQQRAKLDKKDRRIESPAPAISTGRPAPSVPIKTVLAEVAFQQTMLLLDNLKAYRLQEKASLWWVSNQSDDLLAFPYCRIQKLDYQVRTALRVVGALRGRALLSDEVGLGKTIEAGLILKEYLTRGMVKRFLVLTVPSLMADSSGFREALAWPSMLAGLA
jgi:hypothetical protein